MSSSIHIGTSDWTYPQWRDIFYPPDLLPDDWLNHYAQHFSHVEIAESLYKLPERMQMLDWIERTPDSFSFTLTAPRTITHYKKLKNCENQTTQLFTRLNGLEHRFKHILFRLPARWHCNLRRLEIFLSRLPDKFRYIVELTDPSWYDDEVYALLERYNTSLCIHDTAGAPSPLVSTTNLVYVRLSGATSNTTESYHPQTLRGWGVKANGWQRKSKAVFLNFAGNFPVANLRNAQHLERYLVSA